MDVERAWELASDGKDVTEKSEPNWGSGASVLLLALLLTDRVKTGPNI